MDERDLEPEESAPWHLVDQLYAGRSKVLEHPVHVVRLERDMMHARPAPGEEATHVGVLAGGCNELHAALTDHERRGVDTLLAERVATLEPSAEQQLVRRDRLVEVRYGNAEMVDTANAHPRDATRRG